MCRGWFALLALVSVSACSASSDDSSSESGNQAQTQATSGVSNWLTDFASNNSALTTVDAWDLNVVSDARSQTATFVFLGYRIDPSSQSKTKAINVVFDGSAYSALDATQDQPLDLSSDAEDAIFADVGAMLGALQDTLQSGGDPQANASTAGVSRLHLLGEETQAACRARVTKANIEFALEMLGTGGMADCRKDDLCRQEVADAAKRAALTCATISDPPPPSTCGQHGARCTRGSQYSNGSSCCDSLICSIGDNPTCY
jgi:hypothetical protein